MVISFIVKGIKTISFIVKKFRRQRKSNSQSDDLYNHPMLFLELVISELLLSGSWEAYTAASRHTQALSAGAGS